MSFSEKSAWVMLAALLLVFGPYALELYRAGGLDTGYGEDIFGVMIAFVVLAGIGQIAVSVLSPKGGDAASDERDRRIELHAENAAGYTLGAWAIFALFVALYREQQFIANIIFLGLATSEIVKNLWQVVLYRRGA